MKEIKLFALLLVIALTTPSCAQFNWKKVVDDAKETTEGVLGSGSSGKLTNQEVISGLKEALEVGTGNSSSQASKVDGFFKNTAIKLPFPPDAIKVKNTVEDLGMKKQVDEFVLTINRAAEEAAKDAKPIFVSAIKGMSIQDGFEILKGADNAATVYLDNKTHAQLKETFRPKVANAIQKVNVTKYWNPIITKYNAVTTLTGGDKINPDLEDYITERAIQGLFTLIAEEEKKIRQDPLARVSDVLKKVFGSLDKE